MKTRTWILIYFLLALVFVLYLGRSVLTPFVLAAILAYVLNPVVSFIEKRFHLARNLAIALVAIVILLLIASFAFWAGSRLLAEVRILKFEIKDLNQLSEQTLKKLPEWSFAGQSFGLQSFAKTSFDTLLASITRFQDSLPLIFTNALSRVLGLLVFLVATFYFLKDGQKMVDSLKGRFSAKHQPHVSEMIKQINEVLGGYLRGQILLVIIMGVATSIVLTFLGVRFSLVLGGLTGFLELIPFIGPIMAAAIAATVAFVVGTNRLGLTPVSLAILVVIIYFILRQIEDYFVVPQLLGRLTRLHPLVVLFSVLLGGAVAGPVGFILGVPIAASVRILLDYFYLRSSE